MTKVIVTTTINHPTEAIEKFDSLKDWTLIVIGDKKTPRGYTLKNGVYVSPKQQEKYHKKLSDLIGWNCIQRRSFGLLWAKDMNADIIATIDDDNIPYANWGKKLIVGKKAKVNYYKTNLDCFDPIGATNHSHLWHRGFPPQLLSKRDYSKHATKTINVDVQADFWNGDPDIDAFCRMEHTPECKFHARNFPFSSNRPSPFNSQNTFLTGAVLPHYFMIPHIGRMDDIWAAYHVQSKGYQVAYCQPSVYQKRNEQDPTKNMTDEFTG